MEQISVNLIPSGIKGTCHASQFDIGRNIRFALLSGSNIYTLSGTETITLKIRKPDGTEKTETLANTSSTYVDLVTSRDTCDQSGTYDCEITVTDGGVVIGSGNFTMEVEADSLDGIIVVKTSSGAIASFETSLPFPLQEAKFTLPYKAEGYTELTHYKATSTPVRDNAPYRFRKTPSGIGNKCIEKLIGASVNFNQTLQKSNLISSTTALDITITNNNDGTLTFNGTANATDWITLTGGNAVIYGHVYFIGGSETLPCSDGYSVGKRIIKREHDGSMSLYVRPQSGVTYNETIAPQVIDLTAFFGSSTIADHLYNLEQATAGAGVAKFKALGFDAPYFPYTAGQLMSSAPVAKKIIGFNQWDEEWKIKMSASVEYLASKNPIPVFPNTTYYIKTPTSTSIDVIDENDNYILFIGNRTNATFTTPSNCHFIRIATPTANYGTTYNNDICINISDESKNGTYEPHEEKMTIYSGEELRGIFELDADYNIVANGDEDDGSGTGAVIFAEENTDNVTFLYNGDNNWLSGELPNCDTNIDWDPEAISDLPYTLVNSNVLSSNDKSWTLYGGKLFIRDTTKTENELRSIIENKKIVYHRATPTTKSIRTWDNPQPAMAGGTEEFIDGNQFNYYEFTGIEGWTQYDTGFFACNFTAKNNSDGDCEIYQVVIDKSYTNSPDNSIQLRGNKILIKDTSCNDTAALISKITGKYLIYEKAAEGPAEMPCGHDTTYADNLKYSKKTFTQIFGGDLDAVTGDLTSKYNADGTQKTTPELIQLTPEAIIALLGTNTIWNDAGETEVKFVDLKGEET